MATTKVTANVLADDSITQAKLADDAVGAAELASNAVVNASIASGAAIDMDKLDGDSLASAITDFAQDDLVILSDTSDSGNLVKITTSNFEDAIFGNISGDVTLAAGGAATAAAAQTNITSLLATDIKIGEDDQTKIDFETADTINFYAGNEKQLILTDGALTPGSNAIVDLGTDALEFKDAFFDGTVEADAYTVAGTALNEYIADTIGAMVTSNTETGIAVTYEDGDNTLDFVLGTITSLGTISTGVWQGTAIASTYIAADAITGAKIADDAIDSEHYTDGSIDTAHLAADVITGAKIADDAIDSEHYTDGSIDNAHLADDAVDSDEIAAGAIDLAHMSVNSIDSDQYVDGSIDTAHIADNNITHDKLENRYTVLSALGTGGSQTLDFSAATTFTATMNGNATFTITNPKQGQVVDLILAGNHTPTLAMSGATFNKTGSTNYDGSTTNLIQILVADDASSEIFYYSVAPIASDTTP